jgi:hypothetical protein
LVTNLTVLPAKPTSFLLMIDPTDVEACLHVVAPRLEAVLRRHRANYDFEEFCNEIVNYVPDFKPSIFQGIPTHLIVENTKEFFDYKKTTYTEMRKEFLQWLKSCWEYFYGEDAEEIVIKIKARLEEYNQEHRDTQYPKINWVPHYGGIVQDQTPFPAYSQMTYMQEHEIPYEVTGEPVTFQRQKPN